MKHLKTYEKYERVNQSSIVWILNWMKENNLEMVDVSNVDYQWSEGENRISKLFKIENFPEGDERNLQSLWHEIDHTFLSVPYRWSDRLNTLIINLVKYLKNMTPEEIEAEKIKQESEKFNL